MTQDSHDEKRRKHMAVMDDKRKIEDLEAKLAKAVAMLAAIGSAQTSGGGQASVMAFHAREALAEIEGGTK